MPDKPPGEVSSDRYDASVANIRDTVKWLIASIGAVFVTLLAGVQFNQVPFATDRLAAAAGAVAALSVMITFVLAIGTLVGGSLSFRDLASHRRYAGSRRFINRVWAVPPGSPQFERFCAALAKKDQELHAGTIDETDPRHVRLNALAHQLLAAARWHVVKSRFNRLVAAMLLLIPIQLAAAGLMFSRSDSASSGTTLTVTIHSPC